MLEKSLEECLNNAFKFAHENNHEFVTTEHLLLCILNNQDALNVLLACDINIDILEAELKEFISKNCPEKKDDAVEIQPTLSFQRVIQRAVFHVQSSGTGEVTGANILVALFSEKESHSVYLLKKQGMTRLDAVSYMSHGEGVTEDESFDDISKESSSSNESGYLGKYALNLNQEAEANRIDPLVGRDNEIERISQILARRSKNNPILVGESGVGKTALIEGLAKNIVEKTAAPSLQESIIYSLDMGSLLAGTKYRGDFEKRMNQLLDALENKKQRNIFFIDEKLKEIHTPVPDCFLDGITRRTIIGIAEKKGFKINERKIKLNELKNFDACFLTGTAAEVTPVSQIGEYKFKVTSSIGEFFDKYLEIVNKKVTV